MYDMEAVSPFLDILFQKGFSVGIAAFVLLRLEREVKRLTAAIEQQLRTCQTCKVGTHVAALVAKGEAA